MCGRQAGQPGSVRTTGDGPQAIRRDRCAAGGRAAFRLVLLAFVVAVASLPGTLPAQTPHGHYGRQAANPDSHRRYFGIMGEVARPGVYELTDRFPALARLIDSAGGLTADASGNIRIIRNGRPGQQLFYSPNVEFDLLPGDLVVIDGKSAGPSNAKLIVSSQRQNDPAAGASDEVQLAFVQLIDRPVVLKTRKSAATLGAIVSLLGQDFSVLPKIQVISPQMFHRTEEATDATRFELASGTVLVFDRRSVNAARIPPLPEPIAEADQPDGTKGAIAPPPQPLAAVSPTTSAEPLHVAVPSILDRIAAENASRRVETLPPPGSVSSDAGRIPIPVLPASQPAIGALPAGLEAETSERGPRREPNPTSSIPPSSPIADAEQSSTAARPAANPETLSLPTSQTAALPAVQSLRLLRQVVLFGLVAVGCGCWLWWAISCRSNKNLALPVPPSPAMVNSGDRLDAIIRNQLPWIEESPELPPRLDFYGRPAQRSIVRIDSAAAARPQGPHDRRPKRKTAHVREKQLQTAAVVGAAARSDGTSPAYDVVVPADETDLHAAPSSGCGVSAEDSDSAPATQPARSHETRSNSALGLLDRVLSDMHHRRRP